MSAEQNRTDHPGYRAVHLERLATKHYRATNADGASLEFGQGEGLLTPVELLLAAVAGCSAVDVDVVTSRRSEPEVFEAVSSALKITEDDAVRLEDVEVSFTVKFPQDAAGKQAQKMINRLLKLSHDKDCTVSRTIEHPTNVTLKESECEPDVIQAGTE